MGGLSACARWLAVAAGVAALVLVGGAVHQYTAPRHAVTAVPGRAARVGDALLEVSVTRNMTSPEPWTVRRDVEEPPHTRLMVFQPERTLEELDRILETLGVNGLEAGRLRDLIVAGSRPIRLRVEERGGAAPFDVARRGRKLVVIGVSDMDRYREMRGKILAALHADPDLAVLPGSVVDDLFARAERRPFLVPFIALLLLMAAVALTLQPAYQRASTGNRLRYLGGTVAVGAAVLWLLPGLSLYVHWVDQLNRPRTLWLIFASIGVVTIFGVVLYNRFVHRPGESDLD